MRVIKFRAWDKHLNKMIPESQVSHRSIYALSNDDDSIYMQFTGLLDKNGKEIYEGDIVELESNPISLEGETTYQCVIEFRQGAFVALLPYGIHTYLSDNDTEVIGNIFESP